MKFKVEQFPGKWKWRFALLPTWFGEKERIWFEFYQVRQVGLSSFERCRRDGQTVEFTIYL